MTDEIKRAESETNPNPTEKQKQAGNYKKGKFIINGFKIAIENPAGTIRSGVDEDGNKWSIKQKHTYGYFLNTIGKDKDHVDVYIGAYLESGVVYVVDQIHPKTGVFDEHKVMMGFKNKPAAEKAYMSNFEKGWQGFGGITEMSITDFKDWVYNKESTSRPLQKIRFRMAELANESVQVVEMHGEVLEGETLKGLQAQITEEYDVLIVDIASPGGSVFEGLQIMRWFNEISESGKMVVTFVTGNAYSIASLIMLAANWRVINQHAEVMVHNPMIPVLEYANADEMEKEAATLRELEMHLRTLYIAFTKLEDEQIKQLMDNETFLKPEDAVKYGFADKIVDIGKQKYYSANKQDIINKNFKTMLKSLNVLNKVISRISGADVVNQVYSTMEGTQLEIYQKSAASYAIGDRTNLKQGTVSIADGETLVIKDFVIEDKVEKAPAAPAEAGEFNEGEEPVAAEPTEETTEEIVEAITEETSVETPNVAAEEEPIVEPIVEPMPAETPMVPATEEPDEFMARLNELEEKMNNKINELGKLKDEQIAALKEALDKQALQMTGINKFQDVTAEALDTLAQHTESTWDPGKRVKDVIQPANKGSIFGNIMSARGLK